MSRKQFEILYLPRASKFFNKLPHKIKSGLISKIEKIAEDPIQIGNLDIKKLATTKSSWRLRQGNIRVIYEIDWKNKTLYIWEIDFRGNIYKN